MTGATGSCFETTPSYDDLVLQLIDMRELLIEALNGNPTLGADSRRRIDIALTRARKMTLNAQPSTPQVVDVA